MKDYSEPELTVAILAFQRDEATQACLESVRRHVKVPHRVHLYHNGPDIGPESHSESYFYYHLGYVDLFLQSRQNDGLGVGTRNLMASVSTPLFLLLQHDQVLARDFHQDELDAINHTILPFVPALGKRYSRAVASVGLAGPVAGVEVYSERAGIMRTAFYRQMEQAIPLSPGGAGPWSHLAWREGQIQAHYRNHGLVHHTSWPPLVLDRGVWTIRDNPDGSRLHMRTDTKALWWETPPTDRYVFPEMSPLEWDSAIMGQWVGGTIPEAYLGRPGGSFNCWGDVPAPPFVRGGEASP